MATRSDAFRLPETAALTWHAMTSAEVEQSLSTSDKGLDTAEAGKRLLQHGPNRLAAARKRSVWMRLIMQFHNILLYVMMGSAVITAFLGHWVDTGVLMAAVIINAIIGFIQEGKAESALDAIRGMLSPHATVVRDGLVREVDAADLVPGDVVQLVSGDRVPADLRLIKVRELRVEEAALTGSRCPWRRARSARQPTRPWAIAMGWRTPAPWWCTGRPPGWWSRREDVPNWGRSTRCCRASIRCKPLC